MAKAPFFTGRVRHKDARQPVDILLAVHVPQVNALSALEHQRIFDELLHLLKIDHNPRNGVGHGSFLRY